MSVRALDEIGDWGTMAGIASYLTGNPMIAQQINCAIQCILGDCFFDITRGIDWFNLLGSKQYADLDLQIKTAIVNIPGVTRLVEVSAVLDDDRQVSIQYSVYTIYQNTPFEGSTGFLLDDQGNFIVTDSGDMIDA
jgi:hypothetical protein